MRMSRFGTFVIPFAIMACTTEDTDSPIADAELSTDGAHFILEPVGERGTDRNVLGGDRPPHIKSDPAAVNGQVAALYRQAERATFDLRGIAAGRYQLAVRARSSFFVEWSKLELRVNGAAIASAVEISANEYGEHDFGEVELSPSDLVELVFINDDWDSKLRKDRNVWIDHLRLEPVQAPGGDPAPSTGEPQLVHARIDSQQTDELVVEFDRAVTVSDAAGFRLIGGAAHIDGLLTAGSSTELRFVLTDH
ncbi:MAG: hypothetical protein AAGA56_29065, partial [Myxococcota bacterium]